MDDGGRSILRNLWWWWNNIIATASTCAYSTVRRTAKYRVYLLYVFETVLYVRSWRIESSRGVRE